jgi:hypothetical protein
MHTRFYWIIFVIFLPFGQALASSAQRHIYTQALQVQKLENVEYFHKGVFGLHGQDALYFASYQDVATDTALYAQMVQVLSGKFACFINGKNRQGKQHFFRCRDGRKIRIHQSRRGELVTFRARQYDRQGQMLLVRRGQVLAASY